MKKVIMTLVICGLFFGSTAFAGLTKDLLMNVEKVEKEMSLMQTFFFPDATFNEEGKYVRVEVETCEQSMHTSYPMLPYTFKVMTFPFGTKIESIEVKTGEVMSKQLSKKIHPAPNPVPLNMENAKVEIKEGRIYESNEPYPSDWIIYNIGAGIKNGEHVVFLSIHAFPCRYIPAKNELLYT
ncbi:MAG: hypothetical protein FE048_03360, partial [Thermoplasmata archaeon]